MSPPSRHSVSQLVSIITLVLATSIPVSAQEAIPLHEGETLSGSLMAGDTVRYTLDTQPEYFVRGVVDQESVDVAVRILRPDGSQLRSVDVRIRGEEPFQFETEVEGSYSLEVVPVDEEEGDFAIRLDRLEPVATDPEALADQLLSAYDGTDSPGAAVRVWREGETLFSRSYGMANLAYGTPFEQDAPTNIGSTSKQFTAFAVMLLVERGELSLDDDVRTHVPELPDFGETVTVRHLLVHASGYREIYNLLIMAGRRFDQGDYVSRDEIIQVVQNQPVLQNSPGAEWNYNNTAYGLAALIVERVSGKSFTEFMDENVFVPLGMTRSVARPHAQAIVEGRTEGYAPDPQGGYREMRDLGGAIGAGAVYASLEDLQTWVENYHEPRVGTRATMDQMMTSFVTTAGDTTGYGLGLMIDEQRGLKRIHHGGADVAHRSMLVYYPEIGAGITTQSNHASFNSSVAFRLAGAFFDDAMESEDEDPAEAVAFDAASYDPEDFDQYTGRYALDATPAFVITLLRENDRLLAQATGQPQMELAPTSDSTFAVSGVEASLTLHRDDEGEVEGLTLHQGGTTQRASRLEGDEETWTPTETELQAFTGRYLSEEIETFFTIELEGDSLMLKHRRRDDATMTPGERDAFSAANLQISFERDRHGRVIAFYLDNARARDVRFERIR
jgi:CubicO group peptidase (beta-lactamase class C family)